MNGLERLLEINSKGRRIPNSGVTVLGRGVNLADRTRDIFVTIPDEERSGHLGCFGTTRIGKTKLMGSIIGQDIPKGYNVVIIDPKGDIDLFAAVIQAAAESGRLEEVMLLTPIYPDHSIKLDPLSHYYMEDELVDHVVSGIKAKEDYFIAIASEVTGAVVSGLALKARRNGKELNTNFNDIKSRVTYNDLKEFRSQLLLMKEEVPEVIEVCDNIDQILSSTQEFFSKVASSLRTMLSALSTGNTGKIIGKSYVNEFVSRFEKGKGVILYCNTGSLLARRTAHIIGRVLISMVQSMVGRFFASGRKLDPPLCIHIDEGHNIAYMGIQELFSKAGGANTWISFYTQSIALIEQEIGPEAAKGILDNINNWIFMRVNHPDTGQYMEDSSPISKKFQTIITPDECTGRITLREIEEQLILKANVLQLLDRQFYMRSRGNYYKAFTLDSKPPYVEVAFPQLTGTDPHQEQRHADHEEKEKKAAAPCLGTAAT
jgi:type IV secretory pathway TraG/TraD family ATPase VirD4